MIARRITMVIGDERKAEYYECIGDYNMDVMITTKCEKCSEEIALLFQTPASEMYLPTVEQLKDLLKRKDWSVVKNCLCPICKEGNE